MSLENWKILISSNFRFVKSLCPLHFNGIEEIFLLISQRSRILTSWRIPHTESKFWYSTILLFYMFTVSAMYLLCDLKSVKINQKTTAQCSRNWFLFLGEIYLRIFLSYQYQNKSQLKTHLLNICRSCVFSFSFRLTTSKLRCFHELFLNLIGRLPTYRPASGSTKRK